MITLKVVSETGIKLTDIESSNPSVRLPEKIVFVSDGAVLAFHPDTGYSKFDSLRSLCELHCITVAAVQDWCKTVKLGDLTLVFTQYPTPINKQNIGCGLGAVAVDEAGTRYQVKWNIREDWDDDWDGEYEAAADNWKSPDSIQRLD